MKGDLIFFVINYMFFMIKIGQKKSLIFGYLMINVGKKRKVFSVYVLVLGEFGEKLYNIDCY